jgi:hypothetical protein
LGLIAIRRVLRVGLTRAAAGDGDVVHYGLDAIHCCRNDLCLTLCSTG